MRDLELRMYFFVAYNLSPIQQGIQAGHCVLEYVYEHGDTGLYAEFREYWKTWVILNGGTTRDSDDVEKMGSLNLIEIELGKMEIPHSVFHEPDLNDALTAVCFLCDERVFNHKKYQHWREYLESNVGNIHNLSNQSDDLLAIRFSDVYSRWVDLIGGEENVFLKNLIRDKRLA